MIEIIAPVISLIAEIVASFPDLAPSSSLACTASTTTIASSTTIPIARIIANKVNILIENPNICRKKNVPTIATGTAIAGIKVERKSCKKMYTTINTNIKASSKVVSTLSIEASRNVLVFSGIT